MYSLRIVSAVSGLLALSCSVFAISPPPEPAVSPLIVLDLESDVDWNRVDDALDGRLREARRRGAVEDLEEMVSVEAVFSRRIRQEEIDTFVGLGGEIDHVFQAISYGWQGQLPLGKVEEAARSLGDEFVVILSQRELELYLQTATQNVRARDAWGGTPLGLTGNRGSATTRIAIFDTGIDGTHTDLGGNVAFWKDYTPDNEPSPIDALGHGTHVAGIALGSGESMGGEAGVGMTVRYTVSENLSGAPSGAFNGGTQIEFLPGRNYGISHRGTWLGGGSVDVGIVGRPYGQNAGFGILGSLFSTSSPYNSPVLNFSIPESFGFLPYLPQDNPPNITRYAQTVTVTGYQTPDDGFPAFSGIAPLAQWAGIKVFTNAGSGTTEYTNSAFDEMVVLRETQNIKIVNLSLGVTSGLDSFTRAKVNTLALNGILPVVAAGNAGPGTTIGDPGRARLALTVGASNSSNQVTEYSQPGPTSGIDSSMDYKPDLLAPGGSRFFSSILSSDTNNAEARSAAFADQEANDLVPNLGTSMATPVVSGSAALVINALERTGHVWDFESSDSALLVKSILTATATETNQGREVGLSVPPTLQRASNAGPNPYPGKDQVEGYGALNLGAAVQAVENDIPGNYSNGDIRLANNRNGPRAWAARLNLSDAESFVATLDVPANHDLDMHLYAWLPGANGNPTLLAHSTTAGNGANESINYNPAVNGQAILVVKCITGTTTADPATLTIGDISPPVTLVVEQVTSPLPDLFGIGASIPIDVRLNLDDVTVEPSATLQLNAGVGAEATFDSMTAGDTARFLYTVAEGHDVATLAYASLDALGPPEVFTSPSATPPPNLTLPDFGSGNDLAASAIAIDGIRPVASTINLLDPTTTDLAEVRFQVLLSEPLPALTDVSLNADAQLSASISGNEAVGGAPSDTFLITVAFGDPSANGEVSLTVGTNNSDAAGNTMAVSAGSGSYTIFNAPPPTLVVEQVSSPVPGLYGIGAVIPIDVRFNLDDVVVDPAATLQLNVATNAAFDSMIAGDTARFLYTLAEGHDVATLTYASLDALGPATAFTSPSTTLDPDLTLPAFGTPEELATSSIAIDGIRPSVISINLLDPTTTDLDEVRFEVVLSEALAGLPGLSVDAAPALSASISDISPDGPAPSDTWVVTVSMGDAEANGSVGLVVEVNNPDAAGNLMSGPTGSDAYTIENVVVDPVPDMILVY